jgi:uncharacterized protein (TIGR03086 family)
MSDLVEQHRRACDGFTRAVASAAGSWSAPSPCSEWDARGVLEHVIGFQDKMLLEPLGAKPSRPKDDPAARWAVTVEALFAALDKPDALDEKMSSMLGVLTTDVLVHTWDLAKATGNDVDLDPELCEIGYERAQQNLDKFAMSEMFASPVEVRDDASIQDKLLGVFGRDPAWSASPTTG